ncbi:insulinase family protein [Patescibacteria group bacterium]|nr:insulinase family protein [Patescibacteria group bacterium]MBU1472543.1 insulinase family protein [Patescibacteria group bacterium]MBU2460084.1 insulinase family protein [Patescibacteria group bacterium]MBU2544653.1 insulinase family protein [Patescibacteria group bacterium]
MSKTTSAFERIEYPNGVRLIIVPMRGVGSVATSVAVAAGSRYETREISGISHFLEHMVFKGTKKYPTTDDVNFIERLGGIQNAYTDNDITKYHNKAVSTDWRQALEVNRELVVAPLLEDVHVDRERSVIIEEMKRYEDEPAAKAEETFHTMLYRGTRLGMRTIGEVDSLLLCKGTTLRSYHAKCYTPDRMVVTVTGGIKESVASIKGQAEELFGRLTGKSTDDIEIVKENQKAPRAEVVTKPDASQAHLVLGIRTFPRDSEGRFAWALFNLIMGVGFTSRLFKEVREKRGLCYHISSQGATYEDVGNWSIVSGVATGQVEEAIRVVVAELAKVKEYGVDPEEVEVSKKRLSALLAFKSEDPAFINEYYSRQEIYRMPILTIEDYLKKVQKVTKGDIDVLARKYLKTETLNLALVWNKPREEKLERLLKL